MSDIELVIKIPKEVYNNFIRNEYSRADVIAMHTALVNSTPLDKVIEDVKAEIEAYTDAPNLSDKDGVEDGLRLALKIINKHIADMRGDNK